MAEREYKDSQGNVVTLDKLVRIEPEWAANIIRWYEGKLDAAELREKGLRRKIEITEEYATSRLCSYHNGKWSRGRCVLCEPEEATSRLEQYRQALGAIRDGIPL